MVLNSTCSYCSNLVVFQCFPAHPLGAPESAVCPSHLCMLALSPTRSFWLTYVSYVGQPMRLEIGWVREPSTAASRRCLCHCLCLCHCYCGVAWSESRTPRWVTKQHHTSTVARRPVVVCVVGFDSFGAHCFVRCVLFVLNFKGKIIIIIVLCVCF